MIRDPFDMDRFFREIERQIESAMTGAKKFDENRYNRHYTYNDYFMEDENNIYMTVDIGIEPTELEAHIENNDELVIVIDSGFERIKLPTKVEKVVNVTCINGILDIEIRKIRDGREEDEGKTIRQ